MKELSEKAKQALAWLFSDQAKKLYVYLVALCLVPFQPKRQTISAGSFYHDD